MEGNKKGEENKVLMNKSAILAIGLLMIVLGINLVQQTNNLGYGVILLGIYILLKK